MTDDQRHVDELAAWAESDEPTVRPGATVLRGEAARAAARALLEEATADDPAGRELVERVRGRGRPRLNPSLDTGQSGPLWNIRMTVDIDAAMRAQAKSEGRPLSEVVRQAAAEYLAAHHAS
jgi:hypothetical protein